MLTTQQIINKVLTEDGDAIRVIVTSSDDALHAVHANDANDHLFLEEKEC